MRRLSIHRPKAKVRNPGRHLRNLRLWAESAQGKYPTRPGERYRNWKIPVLDRLVEPPTTRPDWQSHALQSLLIAARHFMDAKPEAEKGRSWVAVLVTFPYMWASEVTVFFDREYYESFLGADEGIERRSLCKEMGVPLPPGMFEAGCLVSWENEDEEGNISVHSEERWLIGEPLES